MSIMIYGATGYTGGLIVERALQRAIRPIVAGRSQALVEALAAKHGLDWRVFPMDAHVADNLHGVTTVLHIAGPFSKTSAPMIDGCLAACVNYIDITGEIDVFAAAAVRDGEAKAAGIVLLPGAGFDVVPSDCLAAHVKRRLPAAKSLDLVIGGLSSVSRGTAKTMAEGIARGTRVRESGVIVELEAVPRGTADFGGGLKPTIGVSWGDVATAYHSTGIPDIRVFFESAPELERSVSMPNFMKRFLASRIGQRLARAAINRMPPGPDADAREKGRGVIIASAASDDGQQVASQLETPEGYALTALTAVEIARRVDSGEVSAGYHTPSSAFGPDFILGFAGVTRRDLR